MRSVSLSFLVSVLKNANNKAFIKERHLSPCRESNVPKRYKHCETEVLLASQTHNYQCVHLRPAKHAHFKPNTPAGLGRALLTRTLPTFPFFRARLLLFSLRARHSETVNRGQEETRGVPQLSGGTRRKPVWFQVCDSPFFPHSHGCVCVCVCGGCCQLHCGGRSVPRYAQSWDSSRMNI